MMQLRAQRQPLQYTATGKPFTCADFAAARGAARSLQLLYWNESKASQTPLCSKFNDVQNSTEQALLTLFELAPADPIKVGS